MPAKTTAIPNIRLSGLVITLNEEKNIGNCIDALKQVTDEIIVVDSFSSDETENICHSKGVSFLQHPFTNYAQQKNVALQAAKCEWVLSVDADEILSATLIREITEWKKNKADSPSGIAAYYIKRRNFYCGQWIKYSGWYPDAKLRLWQKNNGQWEGIIHEQVVLAKGTKTAYLKGELLHHTCNSVAEHIRQINNFTTIEAQRDFQKGIRPTFYHLYLKPLWKFVNTYFIKLGFLDGYYGWLIAKNSAYARHLRYVKLQKHLEKERRSR